MTRSKEKVLYKCEFEQEFIIIQMEISLKGSGGWMQGMEKVKQYKSIGMFIFADGEAKEIEYSYGKRL